MTQIVETIVKEDKGELYIEIPEDMLDRLGWKHADELEWVDNKDGTFLLRKPVKVEMEIELSEDELFKYMQQAHREGLSFNSWVEKVLTEMIKCHDETGRITDSED